MNRLSIVAPYSPSFSAHSYPSTPSPVPMRGLTHPRVALVVMPSGMAASAGAGTNRYEVSGEIATLLISRKNGEVVRVVFDSCDIERVMAIPTPWWISTGKARRYPYAATGRSPSRVLLHRLIVDAPDGTVVDHINHDTLDNRRCNLRVTTHSGNTLNQNGPSPRNRTSGVRGVWWKKSHQKWASSIRVEGRQRHLGYFDSIEDARLAYENARSEVLGW